MSWNFLGKLRNMASIFLTCGDEILLLYRENSKVIANSWIASAGGHFEKGEINDSRACVLRELREELGVTENMLSNFSLRYITLRKTEGEIRLNYYFFAELCDAKMFSLSSNEGQLKWFSADEIGGLVMPLTAKFVIEHWCKEGRNTIDIYGGVADSEKVVFTVM